MAVGSLLQPMEFVRPGCSGRGALLCDFMQRGAEVLVAFLGVGFEQGGITGRKHGRNSPSLRRASMPNLSLG